MDIEDLTVYIPPFSKCRLGEKNAGGYVICDIPNIQYDILISGGIGNKILFEEHFVNTYGVNGIIYDGKLEKNPSNNNSISFVKKHVSSLNSDNFTNIHEIIDNHNHIFAKMNIEGYEIPWLESLNETQMKKFEQMIIVFHSPFSEHEKDIFKKINKTHVLVHLHGNNKYKTRLYKGKLMPNVFECTYLNKKYFQDFNMNINETPIPSLLDMPNYPTMSEIHLNYMPFVKNSKKYIINKNENEDNKEKQDKEDNEERVFFLHNIYDAFFQKRTSC